MTKKELLFLLPLYASFIWYAVLSCLIDCCVRHETVVSVARSPALHQQHTHIHRDYWRKGKGFNAAPAVVLPAAAATLLLYIADFVTAHTPPPISWYLQKRIYAYYAHWATSGDVENRRELTARLLLYRDCHMY